MKTIILGLIIWLSMISLQGFANGVGNGGDICEDRFKIVRDDIQSWILNGGSAGLVLPQGISYGEYNQGMLQKISNAIVSCTDDPIYIGQAEKTCQNYVSNGNLLINCNTTRFLNTLQADQYVLVHHEYAGLAGFEVNIGESSSYEISNQITGYLENQIIKKLVVKPPPNPVIDPFDPLSCTGTPMTTQQQLSYFSPGELVSKDVAQFKIYTRSRTCTQVTGCTDWLISDLEFGVLACGPSNCQPGLNPFPTTASFRFEVQTKTLVPTLHWNINGYNQASSLSGKIFSSNGKMSLPYDSYTYDSYMAFGPNAYVKSNNANSSFALVNFDGLMTDHCLRLDSGVVKEHNAKNNQWLEYEAIVYSQY